MSSPKSGPTHLSIILRLSVGAAVLSAVSAVAMFFPLWFAVPALVCLPIYAILRYVHEPFEKLKLLTLVTGRVLVALAFVALLPGHVLEFVTLWLLRINILEAVTADARKRNLANVAGGVVVLAATWAIAVHWKGVYYLMASDIAPYWIAAYTLWNWNFINKHFRHTVSAFHIAVLAAPILFVLVMREPAYWLIMRACSLTAAVTFQIACAKQLDAWFDAPSLTKFFERMKTSAAQTAMAVVMIALVVLPLVLR